VARQIAHAPVVRRAPRGAGGLRPWRLIGLRGCRPEHRAEASRPSGVGWSCRASATAAQGGRLLLITVEVKCTDTFSPTKMAWDRYRAHLEAAGLDEGAMDDIVRAGGSQFLRSVLLTDSQRRQGLRGGRGVERALAVVLARKDDRSATKVVSKIAEYGPRTPVAFWSHEDLLRACSRAPVTASTASLSGLGGAWTARPCGGRVSTRVSPPAGSLRFQPSSTPPPAAAGCAPRGGGRARRCRSGPLSALRDCRDPQQRPRRQRAGQASRPSGLRRTSARFHLSPTGHDAIEITGPIRTAGNVRILQAVLPTRVARDSMRGLRASWAASKAARVPTATGSGIDQWAQVRWPTSS
jgi:hypothetical protein